MFPNVDIPFSDYELLPDIPMGVGRGFLSFPTNDELLPNFTGERGGGGISQVSP